MATPSSNAGVEEETPKRNLEQITFRFCSECSNMLYPKEDEDAHKLQFTCRTCQYTEEATSTCVYRNVMNSAAGETAGVTQDVGSDPTVRPHTPSEPLDSTSSSASASLARPPALQRADSSLAVCLRCGNILLQCNRCQDPVSVEEYNDYVRNHPEFAATRSLAYIKMTSQWNAMDFEGQAAWDDRFASCVQVNLAHVAQESIAHYLPMEIAVDPYADPPEALGVDLEDMGDLDGMS